MTDTLDRPCYDGGHVIRLMPEFPLYGNGVGRVECIKCRASVSNRKIRLEAFLLGFVVLTISIFLRAHMEGEENEA